MLKYSFVQLRKYCSQTQTKLTNEILIKSLFNKDISEDKIITIKVRIN